MKSIIENVAYLQPLALLWLLLSADPLALGAAEPASDEALIWQGQSGGLTIRWTTRDLTATRLDSRIEPPFSVARQVEQAFDAQMAETLAQDTAISAQRITAGEPPLAPNPCTLERDFTVLSVVGSILSLKDHSFIACQHAAHPGGETRFVALDPAKPAAGLDSALDSRVVRLTDFFPEAQVFQALLKDPLIRQALKESRRPAPKTLAELLAALAAAPAVVTDAGQCYAIDAADLLTRFAFHHLEKNQVAVRLGLSGTGVCRENLTQIGILLPIPAALKTPLLEAQAGRQGFLMKDSAKIARDRRTAVTFSTD